MTPILAEYTAELILAAVDWMDGGRVAFPAHCRKYNIHWPADAITQHATVCKVVTGNTRFPMELRTTAKRWLIANNMMPFDDGDVPV